MTEIVRRALVATGKRIKLAFLHGSLVRRDERADSDVDLVVVGDLGLSEAAPNLKNAEERLGRAVNAMVYSENEFAAKLKAGQHFLNRVVKAEKLFLIGSEHELEELAGGGPRATARHEQAGAG
jgi:uncharacterized protein